MLAVLYPGTASQLAEKLAFANVSYQGTTFSRAEKPLFLTLRADFSPRGPSSNDPLQNFLIRLS